MTECSSSIIKIAVDGPSGAGKSTVAKIVADKLGIVYVDTGAMYRAIALKILETGTDYTNQEILSELLSNTVVDFDGELITLDGKDVSGLIRTPEVTEMASKSSAIPAVREKLVVLQRQIGSEKSVIMDGRDIGSNVFPDAEYKFYITASAETRADRRYKENIEKGITVDFASILDAINDRDYNDSHRELNPLVMVDDAIEIDTDDLSIDEVVDRMLVIVNA
jgi:cytidylate kinase